MARWSRKGRAAASRFIAEIRRLDVAGPSDRGDSAAGRLVRADRQAVAELAGAPSETFGMKRLFLLPARMKSFLAAALLSSLTICAQAAPVAACKDAGYHQFDFWLGEWDVFETSGGPRDARASITSVQNGCGVHEAYRSDDGSGGGESLNTFDPHTGLWRQSWLSDRGQIAIMEGRKDGISIIIMGPETGDAVGRIIRGAWTPLAGGAVHETAERSDDGGKTWKPWYDYTLRPHKN